MKILVLGGSGSIGFNLVKKLIENGHHVEFTYFKNKIPGFKCHFLDITDKVKTMNLIKKTKPEIVIHCVSVPSVDLAETNQYLATSINVDGTRNIINSCKGIVSKIIYISSSFVYENKNKVNYETSKTQPNTHYGKTKLEAEILIRESQLDFLILRTDQPYNWIEKWQKENSVVRVLKHLNRKKVLKEIIDWYNVPTYIPDLAKAIEFLIKKEASGIFNVVGDDYVNRYDWSCNVADVFNLNKKLIIPIKSEELNIAVKRPNINLSNKKLVEKTGINMSGIYSGAISMKNEHIKTDK